MRIRVAALDDAAALVPLFDQWGHPQSEQEIAATIALWSATPHSQILLLDDGGRIAGLAAVSASPRLADPGHNAILAGLVVASDYRRQQVGSRLLSAAESLARSWGCRRMELTSSRSRSAAHEFYRARGYTETSAEKARYLRPLDAPTTSVEVSE